MSRVVDILKSIQNKETYNKEALSRAEEILKAICNNTSITMTARSRYETLLLCLKNKTKTTLTPRTRLEEILVAIINGTIDTWITGKNLFDEKSELNINASIGTIRYDFPSNSGGNRHTYFLKVKKNTKYTISFQNVSDRLIVVEYYTDVNPVDMKQIIADKMLIAKSSDIPQVATFETGNEAKVVGIYYSLEKMPKNMKIEIGSTATPYSPYCFLSELEEEYYKTFGV